MSVAILGGTGFVGRNITKVFQENGVDFISTSRQLGVDLRVLGQAITFLDKTRPDFIVNCAAHVGSLNYVTEQAANVILDNAKIILSLYEAVSRTCPESVLINPIANCAYPAKADTFVEDEWWNGHLHRSVLSYGSTRRFLWTVGESFAMQYGIRSISLLVPNMYGPYDSSDPNKAHALNALISRFVKALKENQNKIGIWGSGVAIREWLYAEDFGRVLLRIIQDPGMIGLDEPLNVAQNFGLSIRELVKIIQNRLSYEGKLQWDTSKPDGAPKKVMDDRKFRKVFPDFKFTRLDEGIRNTIAFYESIYPY